MGTGEARKISWSVPVIAALMVLSLVPVWSSTYFPTLDGPVHLNIAQMLADWRDVRFTRLHELFELNIKPEPNWSVYIILGTLMTLFSPETSERIVLSLYILAVPLSFVFFAKMTNRQSVWWPSAILGYLVVYNATLYFGFFNFSLSLSLFVICAALYLNFVERPTFWLGLGVALTSLLLFFTHVLGWAMFALVGCVFFMWRAFIMARSNGLIRSVVPTALRCIAPILPTLLLMFVFMGRNSGGVLVYGNSNTGFVRRLGWLFSGAVLYGNSLLELAFVAIGFVAAAAYGLSIAGAEWKGRPLIMNDALIPAFFAVLVAVFAIPNMLFGGGLIAIRIQIFAFILPLLWLCANAQWRSAGRIVFFIIAIATVGLVTVQTLEVRRMSANFAHVAEAGQAITPNSTILPVVLAPRGLDQSGAPISRGVSFLLHADNWIAMERKAYCLRLSQASTLNFPIHYTTKTNPYNHLPIVHYLLGRELEIPAVWKELPKQTAAYEATTGQTIDYLLIVGTEAQGAITIVQDLQRNLRGRYIEAKKSKLLPGYVLLRRVSNGV